MPFLFPYLHARLYADRSKIPPGSLEGYKAPLAIPGFYDHALSIVRTWTADLRELQALLPKLAPIPTLLMWGSKDPAVYVSSMEPLARHFANVQTSGVPRRRAPALRRVSGGVQSGAHQLSDYSRKIQSQDF